jgi:iron complex transport system permease protein
VTAAVAVEALAPVLRGVARRRRVRRTTVGVGLAAAALTAAVLLLSWDTGVSAGATVAVLVGGGDDFDRVMVLQWQLPRVLVATLVGLGLGLAGALYQSALRNPLASPDIVGISQGASLGAVTALLVAGPTGYAATLGALVGALAVAATNLALSWRHGLSGQAFVLTGVGLSFMAVSLVNWVLTRQESRQAQQALVWLIGSVGSAGFDDAARLGTALAVLLPAGVVLARRLDLLELGDDTAAGLGVAPTRVRLAALVVGTAAAAAAVAVVGPVSFVALTAAPIARRLVGDGRTALLQSVLVGAVVVLLADLVALHFLPGSPLPVGIVTGLIGGPFLIWLLAAAPRRGRTR